MAAVPEQQDLLRYDEVYRILICRPCGYAIQNSALESHLLRHKIYRDDRKHILASYRDLVILEPNAVPTPNPQIKPVVDLPVLQGYCCVVQECGNLCASSKRMQMHHREAHGLQQSSGVIAFARPAKLQTFFRGTKIRYFEVDKCDDEEVALPAAPLLDVALDVPEQSTTTFMPYADSPAMSVMRRADISPVPSLAGGLDPVHLDSIRLFHSFTNVTGSTLPVPLCYDGSSPYWESHVVEMALSDRTIMCGLLALSAAHLTELEPNTSRQQMLCDRAQQLAEECRSGLEKRARSMTAGHASADSRPEIRVVGTQLESILCCTNVTVSRYAKQSGALASTEDLIKLSPFVLALSSWNNTEKCNAGSDERQHREVLISSFDTATTSPRVSEATVHHASSSTDTSEPAVLKRLRSLPYRLADVFGKPQDGRDAIACLAANAQLIHLQGVEGDLRGTWGRMVFWLAGLSEHFLAMIARDDAASLVILAHWAATLVADFEQSGTWWFKGISELFIRKIHNNLPHNVRSVHGLVDEVWQARQQA